MSGSRNQPESRINRETDKTKDVVVGADDEEILAEALAAQNAAQDSGRDPAANPSSQSPSARSSGPIGADGSTAHPPKSGSLEKKDSNASSGDGSSGDGSSGPNASDDSGDDSGEEPKRDPHTSLVCLSLVARHHGVDISADRMIHEYSLEHKEPDLRRILRIAKDSKLKAKSTKLSWKDLHRMGEAYPIIAKLQNGNYVIFVGAREVEV